MKSLDERRNDERREERNAPRFGNENELIEEDADDQSPEGIITKEAFFTRLREGAIRVRFLGMERACRTAAAFGSTFLDWVRRATS